MLTTLFTLLISIFFLFFSPLPLGFDGHALMWTILFGGMAVFIATIFMNMFILSPLSYLEQELIANVLKVLRRERLLRLERRILFLFTLISFFCVPVMSRLQNSNYQDDFFFIWIILFAVSLDILLDSWKRLVNLLNPSFLVSRIVDEAMSAIRNDQRKFLLNDIDNLSEIALRSVEKSKLALSYQVLQAFAPILKIYFESSKSISHQTMVSSEEGKGAGVDEPSYILFYLLQRLELINDRALRDRQETICRQMIMIMGKMIVYGGQLDLSMVAFPTHFLTKFGLKAQQHYFDEVTMLATSTLLEIAKTLLKEVNVTYAELKEPFFAIINGLSAIARATFKKQKESNIKVLIHPLIELKELFQSEKYVHHRDTQVVLQQINNVIDEFSMLEQVLASMPVISEEKSL